jgi:hypothetical protein
MKTVIFMVMFFLLFFNLAAKELSSSDWQHILMPGTGYILCSQVLTLAGMERGKSEDIALCGAIIVSIGKEYYDYRYSGVSTLEDLQLSLISVVSGYYINKGINHLFFHGGKK